MNSFRLSMGCSLFPVHSDSDYVDYPVSVLFRSILSGQKLALTTPLILPPLYYRLDCKTQPPHLHFSYLSVVLRANKPWSVHYSLIFSTYSTYPQSSLALFSIRCLVFIFAQKTLHNALFYHVQPILQTSQNPLQIFRQSEIHTTPTINFFVFVAIIIVSMNFPPLDRPTTSLSSVITIGATSLDCGAPRLLLLRLLHPQ